MMDHRLSTMVRPVLRVYGSSRRAVSRTGTSIAGPYRADGAMLDGLSAIRKLGLSNGFTGMGAAKGTHAKSSK
jgi:hypothetical protein